jgi:cytochrome b subunit of formate dehydrogenase
MSENPTTENRQPSDRPDEKRTYLRFPLAHRIEHWVQMGSFTILAITGLVQKFSGSEITRDIIRILGGIDSVRIIHRVFATILMIAVVYHLGAVIYRLFVKRLRPTMLPSLHDVQAAFGTFLYNLGFRKNRPQQGRYTFEEKMEYWAFVWGTVVMVITGFMLWNPIATTRLMPGEAIPAARTAHGSEAVLAVLAIILWHMYHVHIRTFNRSMMNGKMSEAEMLHEHPLELADIKAGVAERPLDPKAVAQRRRIFWPVYGLLAALLLAGIYWFVSFEQTAIAYEEIPPIETVEVFAPLTPTPLPTAAPTPTAAPAEGGGGTTGAVATWEGGIATLLKQKCAACHGAGAQLGGLNLGSYQSALSGGNSGPGVEPGDPQASQVILKQEAGGHPGQLSDEEIQTLNDWIQAGAPE